MADDRSLKAAAVEYRDARLAWLEAQRVANDAYFDDTVTDPQPVLNARANAMYRFEKAKRNLMHVAQEYDGDTIPS